MRISSNLSIKPSFVSFGGCSKVSSQGFHTDTFEKQKSAKVHSRVPFDTDFDKKLYKMTPKVLREYRYNKISDKCKQAAFDSVIMGNIIRKEYDNKYGKDGYVFVSIGTSPAGVARTLELMGKEVKYVPISGVREIGFPIDELTEYQDYNKYSDFLDSIGLDRKSVIKNPKKHIFCDFTSPQASTLGAVRYFATERRGLPLNKVDFRSLNLDLFRYAVRHPKVRDKVIKYTDDLCNSRLSKYSGIPHLNCMTVNNIEEALKAKPSKLASDFNFAMAYILDEKGLLSE